LAGLGSACNTPAGTGIFSAYFVSGPKRNKAFGALGAGQPVGFIMGLVLGNIYICTTASEIEALTQSIGGILAKSRATWRAIFFIQAGLGFFFAALGWLVLAEEQTPRYSKGLDWGGAFLSTAGFGMLTYSLAFVVHLHCSDPFSDKISSDSTATPKGWSTPQIPSLLSVSVITLVLFLYYERWREARNKSVLMPMSMWHYPGAKMGSVISLVFFAWYLLHPIDNPKGVVDDQLGGVSTRLPTSLHCSP
jgi:hypothetical protein